MKNQKDQNFKEYLKKIEDPTYQREVNKDLPKNPTSLQVAKFKICQEILAYQMDHDLTDKEIAKKINFYHSIKYPFQSFREIGWLPF